MISLQPVGAETYAAFFERAAVLFASENVAAGRWAEEGAIERSRTENLKLLPDGTATSGQFLFDVALASTHERVGRLWLAEAPRGAGKFAFVCQIYIEPAHRRNGYARAALQAAERFASDRSLCGIGLHVFAHNTGAQALYAALEYQVASTNMFKPFAPK